MRYQGFSAPTGELDEMESSAVVTIDRADPALYLDCSDLPSLTRQEFADECDINKLMAQFEKTGIFPQTNNAQPRYLDVSDVPDLQEAHRILNEATASFMSLPATVRRDFDNDPIKFISFAENSDNLPKLREWGLAPPPPIDPPPQKVEIINPAPAQDA
jgi:phage internal scaffolding protein